MGSDAVFCLYAGLGRVGAPHGATPRDLAHVARVPPRARALRRRGPARGPGPRPPDGEGARRGRFAKPRRT